MDTISLISRRLSEEWGAHWDGPVPGRVSPLVIRKTQNRWIALFFHDRSALPFALAKITTHPGEFPSFFNEFSCLEHLAGALGNGLAGSIPAPVFQLRSEGVVANVEKMLHGRPVFPHVVWSLGRVVPPVFRAGVNPVIGWWTECVRRLGSRGQDGRDLVLESVEGLKLRFHAMYPGERETAECIDRLGERLASTCGPGVVIAPLHGDFWQGNLLRQGRKLEVFDWERGRIRGLPVFDIYFFCCTLALGLGESSGFFSSFVKGNWLTGHIRHCIRQALSTLGLERNEAIDLFELFLYEMSTLAMMFYKRKIVRDDEWLDRAMIFHQYR
ncbi:MAG: hypothetical protein WAR22_06530, partial [Desulfomonilia bacterium]